MPALAVTINDVATTIARSEGLSFDMKLGSRGSADFTIQAPASVPTVGQGVGIFSAGVRRWVGTIDDIRKTFHVGPGVAEYRYRIRAVTLEQRLDKILVKPPSSVADPSCTYVALAGNMNTLGTGVLRLTGDRFDKNLAGSYITINGLDYLIASVTDIDNLTLATTAGTQGNVAYSWTPFAGNIFRSIRTCWYGSAENIGLGLMDLGPDVGKKVYDHKFVSEIYQLLAEETGLIWYINPSRELNYHERSDLTGAAISSGAIFFDGEMEVSSTREELTNAHYRRISHNAFSPAVALCTGNGVDDVFYTSLPISILQSGHIEESGEFREVTFGQRDIDTGRDFYWGVGEYKITQDAPFSGTIIDVSDTTPVEVQFSAAHNLATGHYLFLSSVDAALDRGWRITVTDPDKVQLVDSEASGAFSSGSAEANHPIATGDFLRFTYRALGGDVVNYSDATAISARATAEGNNGLYESTEDDTDNIDADGATDAAQAIVDARKNLRETIVLKTEVDTYYPGQLIDVTASEIGISGSYLIDSVRAYDVGDGFRFTISAVDGNTVGGWRKVFAALRKRATGGSAISTVSGGSTISAPSGTAVGSETFYTITYSASAAPDCSNGQNQRITLTGNLTLNAPTNAASKRLTLFLAQDSTGGRTISFDSAYKIPSTFAVDTTPDTITVLDIRFDGSSNAHLVAHPFTGLPA